jgi:hypothetical protein
MGAKRVTFEALKSNVESTGCRLLNTELPYPNLRTGKISYICDCGREDQKRYDLFLSGQRCKQCLIDSQRRTIEDVNLIFRQSDCQLVSTQYKNANEKLEYICQCGRKAVITLSKFIKGQRCKECANDKQRLNHDFVSSSFSEHGCQLLDTFVNSKTKMKFRCKCNSISLIDWNHFNQGQRDCRTCSYKRIGESMRGANNVGWRTDRIKVEWDRKMTKSVRTVMHKVLRHIKQDRKIGFLPQDDLKKLLGYDSMDLFLHLSNHPNWQHLEGKEWHLDHIFPIKAFLEHEIYDIALINRLDNLQPLEKKANLQKSGKYDKNEFMRWVKMV